MIVEVKQLENGDNFIELPDEIITKFNLKEGDDVEMEIADNAIVLKFFKGE